MILNIRKGMRLSPKRLITNGHVKYWQYSAECSDLLGGLLPNAQLEVHDVCHVPGKMWIKLGLPGRCPPAFLKISGEEFALNFLAPSPARPQRPATVDAAISIVQNEFSDAHIRITGRGRTIRRQAELMADRRKKNRTQFLQTYRHAAYISEMDGWVSANPAQSLAATTAVFEQIITRARAQGAIVSNHLDDAARDISVPRGGTQMERKIRARLEELGCHVIDERDAVGGSHWHVDFPQ